MVNYINELRIHEQFDVRSLCVKLVNQDNVMAAKILIKNYTEESKKVHLYLIC